MPAEKILIVEDQQLAADFMRSNLEQLGYNVAGTVSTGEEAIRSAEQHKPDLVLMDIHLQGKMDGIDTASRIRFASNIPVIFVTGDKDDRLLERCKAAEPLGFVMKPFSIRELQSTIETGLNYHRSAHKRNREAIQSLELRYQDLFENAIHGIFRVNQSGKCIDANASLAELFGYKSPKDLLDSSRGIKRSFVNPQRYREFVDALKKSSFVKDFEYEAYRKDGTRIWLSQNTRKLHDHASNETYFEGIVQDITERKHAEEGLKSLLARQTALLAAIPDIIMEVDINKRYTWANSAGLEFFGEDVIGKAAAGCFEGEQNTYDAVDSLWKGDEKTIYVESWQQRKDGQKRLLSWRCHALKDHEGKVIGALASARDITDSKLAEEALRQSEERFKLITETIDDVFWMHDIEEGKTIYVSPAHERIWGCPWKDLHEDPKSFYDRIHPDDRESVAAALAFNKAGEPFEHEYRILRPDGEIRHIYNKAYPVVDGTGRAKRYIGIARDATSRRRAEQALRESEERYRTAIERSNDGIAIAKGTINIFVNQRYVEMFGYDSADELLGKPVTMILHPDEHERWENIVRRRQRGEPAPSHYELKGIRKNGEVMYMEVSSSRTMYRGESVSLGYVRDITERKRNEEKRLCMEATLRQAQKLEAIGQLAAGIAHEINTPTQYVSDNTRFLQDAFADLLNVLEAYDRLLQANRKDNADSGLVADVEAAIAKADLEYLIEEAPKAITQSLEGLYRVATIVRAMKEFSHPGGDEKQTIDLNHAINNTVTVCRNEWKYVAEMALDLDPTLPLVPCLPGDFNQVILNMVVNAAHAIADNVNGGEKHKGTISISTRHDGDWVEIRIGDTGTGIPEEHRAKIFTPFFTTKEVGRGTGQGLAISHTVVVGKHGGTINFETESGEGTVFIIRLPLRPESIN